MKRSAIIDLGTNNVTSVYNACKAIDLKVIVTKDINEIKSSSSLILPGVGSSNFFMKKLRELNIFDELLAFKESGKMIFGICLGMQVLFDKSYEIEETKMLSFLKGDVLKLNNNFEKKIMIPHIGWNKTIIRTNTGLFENLNNYEFFYYIHSYFVVPNNKNIITSECYFGNNVIVSSIHKDNVIGTQFHPENSGEKGIQIYKNFKKMICNV